ncbi:MAG: hypothetical protein OHK0029_28450 [Armatimonadaceae bacterium]
MLIFESILLFVAVFLLIPLWTHLTLRPGFRLRGEFRFAEAAYAFVQASQRMLPWDVDGKTLAMIQASLAFTDAGEPRTGIHWAEKALKQASSRPILKVFAQFAAAHANSSAGEVEPAIWHLNDALSLAGELNNNTITANVLLLLGMKQGKAGDLNEARATAERIASLDEDLLHMAKLLECECWRIEGTYDEALAAAREAANILGGVGFLARSAKEKLRLYRLIDLTIGRVLLEAGRAREAEPYLVRSSDALTYDRRLKMLNDSLCVWMYAATERPGEAHRLASSVRERLPDFSTDHMITTACTNALGFAMLALGEYNSALANFEDCMQALPDPVEEPQVWWGIAQCHRYRNDLSAYRDALRRAVSRNLPTYHTARAREELDTLKIPESPAPVSPAG